MLVSGEPLTPDSQPRVLIPGDWEVLQSVADVLTRFSVQANEARDRLDKVEAQDLWTGDDADGFRKDLRSVIEVLELHGKEYPKIAKKMHGFAEVLRFAQGECANDIIPKARHAFWLIDAQAREQESYDLAKQAQDVQKANGVGAECLPRLPHKPEGSPGADLLREAREQLRRVRERVVKADADAQLELRKSLGVLELDPDMWKTLGTAGLDFLKGAGGGFLELAQFAWTIDPARVFIEPVAYATDLKSIAGGMFDAVRDPVGFAQDTVVTTWEEFKKNPARAAGNFVPDLALTLATRGGSKATTPAQQAARRDNPGCRGADACTREGEPIDVVTGEMVLTQTDVALAGTLPLVLERHHRTAFTGGRWFGERWASTFDQYLRLGADRVTFTAADGMVLRYPVPRPGERVMPIGGYRWPLVWEGGPDGAFTVTDPGRGRSWSFSGLPGIASRRIPVRALVDRNGNRVDYLYDDAGVPCGVTHSGGYRIAVDTTGGLITGFRLLGADPLTHMPADDPASLDLVTFTHDDAGDLTDVVNSSGRPLRFTYDEHHRMTSWTDRNGTWYQYEYDADGRCVRGSGIDGVMDNSFEYDPAAGITRMTDALGSIREYAYNDWSQVVRTTDPLGGVRHTEWDEYNRRVAVTDELGHTTRYAYDALGNTVGVVLPDGTFAVADFDPIVSRPTLVTGLDGGLRRYTYDERGNLLTATDELGAVTTYTHDEAGHMTAVTNALGHTTHVTPAPTGLPLAVTDPLGATTTLTRNAFGRGVALTDPTGSTTTSAWTVEGKPAWRERADGTRESWTWDGEGNLRRHTDPAGFSTSFESTHFDLPAARTTPDGARMEFTYDAELRLTKVTNPQGLAWEYEYDPAGRLLAETDFNGRELTYRHDAVGRLVQRINGAGESVAYTRDRTGLVISQRHAATGRTTTYRHDAKGRLTQATNPDVDLILTRDAVGRIVAESSNGRTLSTTYDVLGRRVRRTTPSGLSSTWTYNAAGQPRSVQTGEHDLTFAFDAVGREVERAFGGDVVFTQEWSVTHHLLGQAVHVGRAPDRLAAFFGSSTGPLEAHRRTYGYRADGYIASVEDSSDGHRTHVLDEVGRVTDVQGEGWTERYAYDAAGNQIRATWPGHDTEEQGDRIVTGTTVHRAGRVRFEYDPQGRVVRRSVKTLSGKRKIWTYTWDSDDRLTSITNPASESWAYFYDALARRTAKTRLPGTETPSAEVTFTWDGGRLVEQRSDGERMVSTWEYRPHTHAPVLQIDARHFEEEATCIRQFAVDTDVAGAAVGLLDAGGERVWSSEGSLWHPAGRRPETPVECPIRFQGQYHDRESGLSYNLFRYYDGRTSTYQSADPLGLRPSFHNYGYPHNPLSLIDPLGLVPGECGDRSPHDFREPNPEHPPDQSATDAMNSVPKVENYDCGEIAEDVFEASTGPGQIVRYTAPGRHQDISIPASGARTVPYDYHEVYTDGRYIYDPELRSTPIPLGDYERSLRLLNGGRVEQVVIKSK